VRAINRKAAAILCDDSASCGRSVTPIVDAVKSLAVAFGSTSVKVATVEVPVLKPSVPVMLAPAAVSGFGTVEKRVPALAELGLSESR
jgi:hypothetical protein